MTNFSLDKGIIEIPCPGCDFPNAATVREIRFGLTVLCRGCKKRIRLVPMNAGLTKVKKAIDKFARELPQRININIKL
jgi:hypothetical protein